MQSKEIYTSIGVLILLAVFIWWGSSRNMVVEVSEEVNQEVTTNTGTQTKKPSSSTGNIPTSVNPTVVPEKPVPTAVSSKNLAGSTFRLATYNGTAVSSASKFTLTFTDNNLSLKLCNTLSTNYYIDGAILKANNVLSTAMYCSTPENIMKIEADVSMMFNSGQTTIYRSGSTLILSHNSGIVLAFEGF